MNYSVIRKMDISNGPGIGVSLFTQGCARAHAGNPCPGCFNSTTWNPAGGKPFTTETQNRIIELMAPDYIDHLSCLGGEPLDTANLCELINLFSKVKLTYPEKKIWVWTGFTFEQLQERWELGDGQSSMMDVLLSQVDYLVDGPFIETQKDLTYRFRGSRNQRVLDCKESLRTGSAVLSEYS